MKGTRTFVQNILLSAPMVALVPIAGAQTASRPQTTQVESYIKGAAVVGFEWVDQPLNRFLLLRSDRSICAIRFLSYHRSNNARPPTSFDTGDASESAVYEISEITLNGAELVFGPVERKKLTYRGMRGLGRLAITVGETDIKCGRDRYPWSFPTGVGWRRGELGPTIAPTNWASFDQIHINHPKLRWYEIDPQSRRPFVVIPLSDLPGSEE